MGQYRCKIVILILFLTLSCNQKTRNTTTVETVTQSENRTLATDSLNLDLLALQKKELNSTTLITVHDDPVYHSTKGTKPSFTTSIETHSHQELRC
jgi:hypothetical protein